MWSPCKPNGGISARRKVLIGALPLLKAKRRSGSCKQSCRCVVWSPRATLGFILRGASTMMAWPGAERRVISITLGRKRIGHRFRPLAASPHPCSVRSTTAAAVTISATLLVYRPRRTIPRAKRHRELQGVAAKAAGILPIHRSQSDEAFVPRRVLGR